MFPNLLCVKFFAHSRLRQLRERLMLVLIASGGGKVGKAHFYDCLRPSQALLVHLPVTTNFAVSHQLFSPRCSARPCPPTILYEEEAMLPRMRTRNDAKQTKRELEAEKTAAAHRLEFAMKQGEQGDDDSPPTSEVSQAAESHLMDPSAFPRDSGKETFVGNLGKAQRGPAPALTYICSAIRPRNPNMGQRAPGGAYRPMADPRFPKPSRPLPS